MRNFESGIEGKSKFNWFGLVVIVITGIFVCRLIAGDSLGIKDVFWGIIGPLFLVIILFDKKVIFTNTCILEKYKYLPIKKDKIVLEYNQIDSYYKIYSSYGSGRYTYHEEEYWFVKNGQVVYALSCNVYKNTDELLTMLPSTVQFLGEMDLSESDYKSKRLNSNQTKQIPVDKVSVKTKNVKRAIVIFSLMSFLLVMAVFFLLLSSVVDTSPIILVLFLIFFYAVLFITNKNNCIVSIDGKNRMITARPYIFPLYKKQILFDEITEVVIDRKKHRTKFMRGETVWCAFYHVSVSNCPEMHQVLHSLSDSDLSDAYIKSIERIVFKQSHK